MDEAMDAKGPEALAGLIVAGKNVSLISNNQTGQPFSVSGSGSASEVASEMAR